MFATLLNSHNPKKITIFWKCSVCACIPCTTFSDYLQRKSWQVMLKSALKGFTSWQKPYAATGSNSVACDLLTLPFLPWRKRRTFLTYTGDLPFIWHSILVCWFFPPVLQLFTFRYRCWVQTALFPMSEVSTARSCLLCLSLERGVPATREAKWIWSSHAAAPVYILPSRVNAS